MSGYREIVFDVGEGIATITLNRPEKMNAYTVSMAEEIMDALDRTDADDAVRAVIFTGAGERAYCARTELTPEHGGGPWWQEPDWG